MNDEDHCVHVMLNSVKNLATESAVHDTSIAPAAPLPSTRAPITHPFHGVALRRSLVPACGDSHPCPDGLSPLAGTLGRGRSLTPDPRWHSLCLARSCTT
jgi:hypothetical protein